MHIPKGHKHSDDEDDSEEKSNPNNGKGNGDQEAPGGSTEHNNAENAVAKETEEVVEDVSEEEIETVETESETLTMLVSDEINIDFTAMENIPSSESQTNVNTENISLNLNDVLFDNNENVLDESNSIEETSDLVTEESSSEWTLGDFKTDAEIGITNQEVMGVDDQTLTLEINTEIMIDQN